MAASYPEAFPHQSPAPRSSLFPRGPTGRAKGPAFPTRGFSTKPSRGRGRAVPGSTRGEGPPRGPCGGGPPGAAQLQRPQSWVLRVFSVLKPTSRNLPLPARPGSPGAAREKPKVPEPPSCVPQTALIPSLPPPRTSASPCSRAGSAVPKLAPVQRAERPDSAALGVQPAVWFELGSMEKALWPWPLHPSGTLAEARPLRWPARQQRERATPSGA
jgi:hypothetical protein